jgi:hypothetical protein
LEDFTALIVFLEDGIKLRDYDTAYDQSHRENMPVDRYKAIRQLYFDAEKEMQYKKKFGRWN